MEENRPNQPLTTLQHPEQPKNEFQTPIINNEGNFSVILGIIVVFIIGGVSFYYFAISKKPEEPIKVVANPPISNTLTENQMNSPLTPDIAKPTGTPSVIPTPGITVQTAEWKTYTGNGMSFQYPGNGVIGDAGNVYPVYINAHTDPHFIFSIGINDNPNHLSAQQVAEENIDDIRKNPNAPWLKGQADQMNKTLKEYNNGLIHGVALQSFFEGDPSGFGTVIYTTNDKIYSFVIHNGDGYVTANEEKILDKILSSVKFIK